MWVCVDFDLLKNIDKTDIEARLTVMLTMTPALGMPSSADTFMVTKREAAAWVTRASWQRLPQ